MTVQVRDYMVLAVEHLDADTTVGKAIETVTQSRHHGMPVTDLQGRLIGFISTKELLRHAGEPDRKIREIIRTGTYTATPDMEIDDVARIMFRFGLRDLPIIDAEGKLCGVISNLDIVRSHFERASPAKAETLRKLLAERYHLPFTYRRGLVSIASLKPTQWKVYEDELEGRRYELERGFAEPVLVVEKGPQWILVDGHHRALAAREMGLQNLQAFVLSSEKPEEFARLEIGLERIAKEHHLDSLDNIEIDRASHHPLIEITTQLIRRVEPEDAKGASDGA
jgi:CBS domain-containing protein